MTNQQRSLQNAKNAVNLERFYRFSISNEIFFEMDGWMNGMTDGRHEQFSAGWIDGLFEGKSVSVRRTLIRY